MVLLSRKNATWSVFLRSMDGSEEIDPSGLCDTHLGAMLDRDNVFARVVVVQYKDQFFDSFLLFMF